MRDLIVLGPPMRDPIDDGAVDPHDEQFSDDFCRLLREGLVRVGYQSGAACGDELRFTVTPRGRAELQDPIGEPS